MSSRKRKNGKVLKNVQKEIEKSRAENAGKLKKAQSALPISPLDVSSIDKASFFEDADLRSFGNPLHSTALEAGFSPNLGLEASPQKNSAESDGASRTQTLARASRVEKGPTLGQTSDQLPSTSLVPKGRKRPAPRKSLRLKSRTRALQGVSKRAELDEATRRRRQSPSPVELIPLCSVHESTDDSNEEPSGKKSSGPRVGQKRLSDGRQNLVAQKRKSSSGSSGDAGPSNKNKRQERDVRNPIDLDVVLDSFLDFVSYFKETVDSAQVRKSIDAVSAMFEDQLTELITNTKELNCLKRENMKINSTINKKRSRLVEIKSELMTKESQLKKLQKEHAELQERLTDLRKGTYFLSALSCLYKNYQAHRQSHLTEEELYGPSSVPALLLETRGLLGAESQLKNINDNLQQALEQSSRH